MVPLSPHRDRVRGPSAGVPGVAVPHREEHGVGVIEPRGQLLGLVDDRRVAPLEGIRLLGFGRRALEQGRWHLHAIIGQHGVEAIVPNETLVTTTVLNHSYSTRNVRLAVQVQISYDSDVDRALALMEEAGRSHERVLKIPDPPTAFLASFADNGIVLELGVWIADPEKGQLNLRSALNRKILKAFGANGIRLPFPQRDVRIVATPSSANLATKSQSNVAQQTLADAPQTGPKLAS